MQVWTNSTRDREIDSYDYDVEMDGDTTVLRYSNTSRWNFPGKAAASLKDTGNGLLFKSDKHVVHLDYLQALQLLTLLLIKTEDKIRITEQKTIREI